MASLPSMFAVMLTGAMSIVIGFRATPPHRLSLLCIGAALIIGPLAHSANDESLQIAGAGVAMGLSIVSLVNSASALIRRATQPNRHS
jgi:hypothetical protein